MIKPIKIECAFENTDKELNAHSILDKKISADGNVDELGNNRSKTNTYSFVS
jgi:hypothetical protein